MATPRNTSSPPDPATPPPASEPTDPLSLFSPYVAEWFRTTFGTPTPPQAQGWPVIARGDHALIISPTGSGKTLTAFLWSLDTFFRSLPRPDAETRREGDPERAAPSPR